MPAAQRAIATSAPSIDIATTQAYVNSLITAMVTGKSIVASDIHIILEQIYSRLRPHTHSSPDLRGIDSYGNVAYFGTTGLYATPNPAVSSTTEPAWSAANTSATPATISADNTIRAVDINVLIAIVNTLRSHYHTINDVTA